MAQEPLTPTGVQQKLSDLYALSNNALQAEAAALRADYVNWVNTNFILNTAQLTYLTGMDAVWLEQAANDTALAMANRLPITFTAPVPLPAPSISKMIELDKQLQITYSQLNGVQVTGSLEYTLTY